MLVHIYHMILTKRQGIHQKFHNFEKNESVRMGLLSFQNWKALKLIEDVIIIVGVDALNST